MVCPCFIHEDPFPESHLEDCYTPIPNQSLAKGMGLPNWFSKMHYHVEGRGLVTAATMITKSGFSYKGKSSGLEWEMGRWEGR